MVPGITVKRSRTERAQDIIIGALLMACFCVAAAIAVLQFPIPLRDTPIIYHAIQLPPEQTYCPGDRYVYDVDIEVTAPGIMSLHVGVKRAKDNTFIQSTLKQMPSVPRSEASRVLQTVGFEIPDLPPDDYVRVAAIDADHVDSVPVFVEIPFTIREGCSEEITQ